MKIYFHTEEKFDFYFCYEVSFDSKVILPETICVKNFFFFLQSSLDNLRPVLIVNQSSSLSKINKELLLKNHYVLEDDFIFLNYSIRNFLSQNTSDNELIEFKDIRFNLEKILHK